MPNKKQEAFCRDEFDRWLKGCVPAYHADWEAGNESPDFWLTLASQKYAVEITRIADEEKRTLAASLWRAVADAKREAERIGELSGTYLITINGRFPPGKGKLLNQLKALILDFVKRTALLETHEPEIIPVGTVPFCKIQKLAGRGATIAPFGGPDEMGMNELEISSELTQILTRSLTAKSKIPRYTNLPTILILYDVYWQVDQELFMECLNGVLQKSAFHTIYVVQNEGSGFVGYQARPF